MDKYISIDILNVVAKFATESLAYGFLGTTVIIIFTYGIFKAFSLLNIKA